jgi:hypothetical protein
VENINLTLESFEGNEIVIREGQALPPVAPKRIAISGDIRSVYAYVAKRNRMLVDAGLQAVNPERAIVTVDKEAMSITLELDPEYQYGTVVTAKLEPNPDLKQFQINGNKTFKQKELVDLLKFSRLYFEDFDKHGMLLRAYQAFNAKAFIDMSSESDSRSNKAQSYSKKVETNLPTDFVMNIPIFKGQEKKRFHVEICFEVTDGGCNFWFESVELKELQDIESETILNKELEACKEFVIIWK